MTNTSTDYITAQQFLDYTKSKASTPPANIADSITAASREIDDYCGRRFYMNNETQYFSADLGGRDALWVLPLGDMDIANTVGLTVNTETGNDGLYATSWTLNTDFICEPVNQSQNGIEGWPYTHLRAVSGKVWPLRLGPWMRPTIKIVGNFGWLAVPAPVVQAAKILTNMYVKLADAPLGAAGMGEFGVVRVKDVPQVCKLLKPYQRGQSLGVA